MGRDSGRLREEIKKTLFDAGAVAVGFAKAEPVEFKVREAYERWLQSRHHAGMEYMERHKDVRYDPRLLLNGAKTLISMAFSYCSDLHRNPSLPHISSYAFLPDYHKWIRKLIRKSGIGNLLGEEHKDWRICIDSAPVLERYWAAKAGIAIIGRNGSAIIPGCGCKVFLAEIVCRQELMPDLPLPQVCGDCMKCISSCPTGALAAKDGTVDCNVCISYLTIEHKGEWLDPRHRNAMSTEAGRTTLFGCDRCVESCPYNKDTPRALVEPLEFIESYVYDQRELPAGSCLKRAGREGLSRNSSIR